MMIDTITRSLPWRNATATIRLQRWMEQRTRTNVEVVVRVRYRAPLTLRCLFARSPAGVWELEWDETLSPAGSVSALHARSVLGPLLAELLASEEMGPLLAKLHVVEAMKAWERLHQARVEAARAAVKVRAAAAEFGAYGAPEGDCARLLGEFYSTGDLRQVGRGRQGRPARPAPGDRGCGGRAPGVGGAHRTGSMHYSW
ncbi:hypothetical protein ACFC6U_37685 [Kitasatospora purpeofusca]|uniref:hypothetical protein n=1 Tax=Kitasatospora purpeofusca TaxID=67352 RepID=UPI0035E30D4A